MGSPRQRLLWLFCGPCVSSQGFACPPFCMVRSTYRPWRRPICGAPAPIQVWSVPARLAARRLPDSPRRRHRRCRAPRRRRPSAVLPQARRPPLLERLQPPAAAPPPAPTAAARQAAPIAAHTPDAGTGGRHPR